MDKRKLDDKPIAVPASQPTDGWLSRGVAWAMPWLFLSLRRALIPTVCLIILAVLFYLVPQSRDILGGFAETASSSGQNVTPQWNTPALVSYLAGSILAALAAWYSARLLCTVEAWLGMPMVWELHDFRLRQADLRHLESPRDEKRVRHAIRWLPRTYGVAALAAAIGALEFANLGPEEHGVKGLGLVAFSLAGPLFVSGAMRHRTYPDGEARRLRAPLSMFRVALMTAGAAAFALSCWQLLQLSTAWEVGLLSASCTLLPAALLWFLMARRALVAKFFSTDLPQADEALPFDKVIIQVFVFVVLGFGALLSLAFCSAKFVRDIGSAATVMLFLAAAVVLISGIQLLLRHVSRAVPGFTSFVAIVVSAIVSIAFHEPIGYERLVAYDPPHAQDKSGNASAVAEPRLIVNAYGGGLRAAIYTAQVLALADDASCGKFGEHIQAMSGVSGGSLGIAVYLTARQELLPHGLWTPCKEDERPLTKVVTQALVQDHLSPAIAKLLSRDLLPIFKPQRGQAMLDSWNEALVEALKAADAVRTQSGYTPQATLAMHISQLNGAIVPVPAVFFNTTDADSGARAWFSNLHDKQSSFTEPQASDGQPMVLGEAVLNSARFPIISPAGAFPASGAKNPHRLVDGGYADNSGAQTLADYLTGPGYPPLNPRPVLLDINGNPPDLQERSFMQLRCPQSWKGTQEEAKTSGEATTSEDAKTSHIPTSVLALLSARSAHALDSEEHLVTLTGVPQTDNCKPNENPAPNPQPRLCPVQINLEKVYGVTSSTDPHCKDIETTHMAPLGWYTSQASSTLIARSSGVTVTDVCKLAEIPDCKNLQGEIPTQSKAPTLKSFLSAIF